MRKVPVKKTASTTAETPGRGIVFLAGKVREYSVIGESVLFWRIGSKNITEVFRLVSVIGAKL